MHIEPFTVAIPDEAIDDLKRRRDAARAAGRKYGIGYAVVVEPAMSNMGYLSTLLTPDARDKAGPKNGASSASVLPSARPTPPTAPRPKSPSPT